MANRKKRKCTHRMKTRWSGMSCDCGKKRQCF